MDGNEAVHSLPLLVGTTMNDSLPPKPERRWYQFSLRTLLVFGLFVLCGFGPPPEQQPEPSEERQAIDAYKRGVAYYRKREHDKAIADFTEAIRLSPKHAKAYRNRGIHYYLTGEHDKAIAEWTEAIQLNPKYADAYFNRGNAYADKGERAKAEADFAKAKELGYEPE